MQWQVALRVGGLGELLCRDDDDEPGNREDELEEHARGDEIRAIVRPLQINLLK